MEIFPRMKAPGATVRFLDRFGGLDRTDGIAPGAWAAEENLSARRHPALATRPARQTVKTLSAPGGLISKEYLWYVDGSCLKHDDVSVEMGLTAGDKQLLSMGAYLLVWPDKKYLNTADLTDKGSMERTNTAAAVTVTPCRSDGRALSGYTAADTPPASPVAGQHWLDTSGDAPVLKTYRGDTGAWEATDSPAVTLTGSGIGAGFQPGDGVELSGFADESLNGTFCLLSATNDTLVLPATLAAATGGSNITAKRTVPDMDFVTECDNRIWGCKYGAVDGAAVNEIYACKLGDFTNWRCFQGLSTDSYAASRGSDGPWTAAVTYGGSPLFFKADCVEKVYPSPTGAHRIVTARCQGVAPGCHRSVCTVEGTLYYLGAGGVCAYGGALPRVVSRPLGDRKLTQAAAGVWEGRYYLSARRGLDWELLTYDVHRDVWHREDDLHAVGFAEWNGSLYAIGSDKKLLRLDGGDETLPLHWYAESGPLLPRWPHSQYIRRLIVRCDTHGAVKLEVQYDGGVWESAGQCHGHGAGTLAFPVRPRRCARLRLRLSGDRACRIDAVSAYWEGGSDAL